MIDCGDYADDAQPDADVSGAAQHGAQFSAPQLVLGQIRIRIRQYCHARCVNVTDDLVPLCRRGRIAYSCHSRILLAL